MFILKYADGVKAVSYYVPEDYEGYPPDSNILYVVLTVGYLLGLFGPFFLILPFSPLPLVSFLFQRLPYSSNAQARFPV